jgi:hypothetical protein
VNKILATTILGGGVAAALMSGQQALAVAHATPNADAIEQEGVCEIFDNSGGEYRFAFQLAVIAVKADTGMNDRDAIRFARQAVYDRCPAYKMYLS